MAMLFRTRKSKISFGLKVFCLVSVTLTYSVLAIVSRNAPNSKVQGWDEEQKYLDFQAYNGRQLLGLVKGHNCTPAAINEFPSDGLTRAQRQGGWIAIHVIFVCYLFFLLAVVCDDYFVPAIKRFCDSLHMKEDIAGATFMAMASSSPELFINCVGTFVTEGDIGVGAIVGSAVFNVLAVPACCGLFGNMDVDLEWWPISRDTFMYGISVVLLITFLQDGKIYFYEALTLFSIYIVYILVMFCNDWLMSIAHRLANRCRRKRYYTEIIGETNPLLTRNGDVKCNGDIHEIFEAEYTLKDCEDLGYHSKDYIRSYGLRRLGASLSCSDELLTSLADCTISVEQQTLPDMVPREEESTKIWEWPSHQSRKSQAWWVLTWPISFLLHFTTPDCRKYPKLFVFTFIMCIFWIGMASYMISWLITAIGDTLGIPDSVMGLTFLAAGMSVPEAVSSVIVTNQGHGSMGLSSSIGSNTFDILLCLGLPWLIKTLLHPKAGGKRFIKINSSGLNYSAISLLSTLVIFYLSIAFSKFKLNWKVGVACLFTYLGFLVCASLIELNVFFPVNLPTCDR